MSTLPKRLRFGVMCDGTTLGRWQAECIRAILDVPGTELALLIINQNPPVPSTWRQKAVKILRGRGLFWLLFLRFFPTRDLPAMQPVDMSRALQDVPRIHCNVRLKGKHSEYFEDDDVETIRAHELDFVLRFAFNIIRGDILDVATYGVWSFHHDSEIKYRGGPPGFWEIYESDRITGAILQKLNDRLDGGVVLQRCAIETDLLSWRANVNAIMMATLHLPAFVCKDILSGCADYVDNPASKTDAPIYRAPTNSQFLAYLFKIATRFAVEQFRGIFFSEFWNVGVVDAPIATFLGEGFDPDVRWLEYSKKDAFVADPFAHHDGLTTHIVMEEFSYEHKRGRIVSVDISNGGVSGPIIPAIDEPFHMAYPYILRQDGALYCIPETYQRRGVFLYRFDTEQDRWIEEGPLLEGFAAVDPTVIHHEGRWWLFCTDRDNFVECSLLLWHADDLRGPWSPHSKNPVKVDVQSSRPGGTPFWHEGNLYRPAQDSSESYGGRLCLNRVTHLTLDDFREEAVRYVAPLVGGPYPHGIHTLSTAGPQTVVDSKRMEFHAGLAVARLVHKMKRLTGLSRKERRAR